MEYKVDELVRLGCTNNARINNKWVPARPKHPAGFYGIKLRVKAAWKVLTGKADIVIWPEGQ